MKISLDRRFVLLIGSLTLLGAMANVRGQGPEEPGRTPLKGDVTDKCGGGKRELTLPPGKYQLSVLVIDGIKSCPVLLRPTEEIPGLPMSAITIRTNRAQDFEVPNDGKEHKLVLQCGTPDHDQKSCHYKYSVTPVAATPGSRPPRPPAHASPTPTPITSPTPSPNPGPLAGAPAAKVCKENHDKKTIHKAQNIFILTVYHDSNCPVKVSDGMDFTLEPGHTRIIARTNVTADEPLELSCGDSETKYCRYKDQELAGVTGTIIEEPVNTSCEKGTTTLETSAHGLYFLDVAADSTSDCPPQVKFSGPATLFQDEANPVQPGSTSQFGFNLEGPGEEVIEISCGTDPDKKCIYTYRLFNAKRKLGRPPKLPHK
jgi:hypothetical protein